METPALHNQEVLAHESDWMLRPEANGCRQEVAESAVRGRFMPLNSLVIEDECFCELYLEL